MTPRPYVAGQAAVLLVGLLALGLIGAWPLVIGLTAVLALGGAVLVAAYRRAVLASKLKVPEHRAGLDRFVAGWQVVVVAAGTVVGTGAALVDDPILDVTDGLVAAILQALVVGATGVLLGSLIDWWWVLPRISGQLGSRPCRATPRAQRESGRRFSWEETTRFWYLSRIVAAVVVIVAGAVVVLDSLRLILGDGKGTTALAGAGGVLALLVGAYRQHIPWGVMEMLNPHARVGDMIAVDGRDSWCVDVSLEGVKYIDMAEHRARWDGRLSSSADEAVIFEPKFDGSVPLTEAKAIRHRSVPRPCPAGRCTGANWYCIENSRCFEKPD